MDKLFRPSATVSRIGLMVSRGRRCRGGPPPPPPWLATPPPPKLLAMMQAALWSHVWVVVVEDPPTPPRDGWLGHSSFTLTKRTCWIFCSLCDSKCLCSASVCRALCKMLRACAGVNPPVFFVRVQDRRFLGILNLLILLRKVAMGTQFPTKHCFFLFLPVCLFVCHGVKKKKKVLGGTGQMLEVLDQNFSVQRKNKSLPLMIIFSFFFLFENKMFG